MATVKKARRVRRPARVEVQPPAGLVALSRSIYAQTRHLHGLTKTSAKLLRIAAELHSEGHSIAATGNGKSAGDLDLLCGLPAAQRSIVRQAIQRDWPANGIRPPGGPLGSKEKAVSAIASRLAAVLQMARAVARLDPRADSVRIQDDGQSVEFLVSGRAGGEAPLDVLRKTALWNRVALRPCELSIVATLPERMPWIRGDQPMAEAGRRILQRHTEFFLSREYGLPYTADVEYVHELRVASRRLRAAMRIFGRSFRGRLKQPSERFQKLAALLGEARDCDVFLEFLRAYTKKNPKTQRWLKGLVSAEKRRRRQAYGRLAHALAASGCQGFLRVFYESLKGPAGGEEELRPSAKGLSRTTAQEARKALRRGLARVSSYGRKIADLTGQQQHDLRIACKKLRYAAESFAEIYPPELEKLIRPAVELQELLGRAHDADVYADRIEVYFRRSRARKSAKVVRAIRANLRGQSRRCLVKAEKIWKRFTATPTQTAFARLVQSARAS